MPTVTGLTAARMEAIENQSIVDGSVVGSDLILTRYDGGTINAGNVRGPQGIQGPMGDVEDVVNDGVPYVRRNGVWIPGMEEAPEDGGFYQRKESEWVDASLYNDLAKAAAKGFIDEKNDGTNTQFGGIGNVVYMDQTTIAVTNNDDIPRNYLLIGDCRLQSISSKGLYRMWVARSTPTYGNITEQMQVKTDGTGTANAVSISSTGNRTIPAGVTETFRVAGLRVDGGTGQFTTASLSVYDMGGVLA